MESLSKFMELKEAYSDRMNEMTGELKQLRSDLEQARIEMKRSEIADFESNTKATKDAIGKARQKVDQLQRDLGYLDERIELFKSLQGDRLRDLYPKMVEQYVEVQQKALAEIADRAVELKVKRAEFLLKARELHSVGNEARCLHQELANIASQLDVPFNHRFDLVQLPITANFAGVDQNLAPLPHEVVEAYQLGQVPAFVEIYGITGAIVENNLAVRQLAEIKKNGGVK